MEIGSGSTVLENARESPLEIVRHPHRRVGESRLSLMVYSDGVAGGRGAAKDDGEQPKNARLRIYEENTSSQQANLHSPVQRHWSTVYYPRCTTHFVWSMRMIMWSISTFEYIRCVYRPLYELYELYELPTVWSPHCVDIPRSTVPHSRRRKQPRDLVTYIRSKHSNRMPFEAETKHH